MQKKKRKQWRGEEERRRRERGGEEEWAKEDRGKEKGEQRQAGVPPAAGLNSPFKIGLFYMTTPFLSKNHISSS